MFFHVSRHALRSPTLAHVASVHMWGTPSNVAARTRLCASVATKRKKAAIPFAAIAYLTG